MNGQNEESHLLNPEEILKKGKVKSSTRVESESDQEIQKSAPEVQIKNPVNTGGTVEILFESGGRFGNPEKLLMKDLLGSHINNIITSKPDKLLETTVACLNECVVYPQGFKIEELTNEEFFEVLLAMKVAFDSVELKHRWSHSCQDNVPEKDRKLSESPIDLRDLQTISIEQADENLKEFYRARLNEYSDDQFKEYVRLRYGKDLGITREQEIEKVKIKPIINIPDREFIYEYSYMKVKYLIEAQRLSSKEIDHLIRIENSKSQSGKSKEEMAAIREDRIEDLNREKARKFLKYSQALCLVGKTEIQNGNRIIFSTVEEKIMESDKVPRNASLQFINALEKTKYGINHECELECNLCEPPGNLERGYLQRIISPFELLPISDSQRDFSKRGLQQSTGLDFYF